MFRAKDVTPRVQKFVLGSLLLVCLLLAGSMPCLAQKARKIETTAMGTSTQLGRTVQVTLYIYDYSTEDDRKILIEAFDKGQNQGLVNALEKMNAVGRIAISGSVVHGYDVSYIRLIPTPTGSKIRFVTNRLLQYGETYYSPRSVDYNLTGGEINLDAKDKSKSTGVLYPAAKLTLDKDKQLSIDLVQNAWQLTNIIDWGAEGK
jgi:hypothetical protein